LQFLNAQQRQILGFFRLALRQQILFLHASSPSLSPLRPLYGTARALVSAAHNGIYRCPLL
jgi:hypothetical protein